MDSHDELLAAALDNWRTEQSQKEGLGDDELFGSHFVLCDDILERIVSLAHHSKIATLDDFIAQTNWCFARDYGPEILRIVKIYFPEPPPITTAPALPSNSVPGHVMPRTNSPVPSSSANNATSISAPLSAEPSKRRRTCKNCGSNAHICMYFFNSKSPNLR